MIGTVGGREGEGRKKQKEEEGRQKWVRLFWGSRETEGHGFRLLCLQASVLLLKCP